MTDPMIPAADGEIAHEASRKKFWRALAWCGVGGLPIGVVLGLTIASGRHPEGAVLSLPPVAAIALVVLALALFIAGCWKFFTSIDEVEMADNLWASMIGFYFYVMVFPGWWLLALAGVVPPVDNWILWAGSLVAGMLEYGRRKWVAR